MKIEKNKFDDKSWNIYGKYGQYMLHESGVLWFKIDKNDNEKSYKEAYQVDKIAQKIFGNSDYPISCQLITNVFEKEDRNYFDGDVFAHPISKQQISEFLETVRDSL